MNIRLLWLLTILWCIAGTVPSLASASERYLEEIVVTAQKREEALTDVPISIQVTSGEFLDEQSVKNLREFVNFVPGMTQGAPLSSAQPSYQVRSITRSAGDPTVGFYIDDAPFYYPNMILGPVVRTVGIERIEVLKGPQSTLYGNGAMGGVVRVIPRAPNLESFEGSVLVGYTDIPDGESGHSADLSLSFPLIQDKLGIRLTAGDQDAGGWIDRQPHAINFTTFAFEPVGDPLENYGDTEISDYRMQVLAEPNERLTLKLLVIRNKVETSPTGLLQIDEDTPTSASSGHSEMNSEYDILSGSVSYEFDKMTLTSVFTEMEYKDRFQNAFISRFGLPIFVIQEPVTFSNETRLVSHLDGRWQWIAGIYYVNSELEQFVEVPAFAPLGTPQITQTSFVDSEQKSVFIEVSYDLIEDKLTALVGLRYFEDDRTFGETANLFPFPLPDVGETFDSVNPRVNLAYTPDENSLYFFNFAKGFRSGLINAVSRCASIPPANPLSITCLVPIDSDELWSYELGMKRTLQDGRLVVDATLYYQDWRDVQGNLPAGTIATSLSYGHADGVGLDLAISWSPETVPELDFRLAANWNNMEFYSLHPHVVEGFAGAENLNDGIPSAPEFSSTASVSYGKQLSSNLFGQFSLSWNHIDEHASSPLLNSDERDYLNVRAGLRIGESLGIHLYGTNITDDDGVVWRQDNKIIETPRRWGIEVSYDF